MGNTIVIRSLIFSRVDCVTFCEQTLALAISSNYDNMFENLKRIRYHNGQVGHDHT